MSDDGLLDKQPFIPHEYDELMRSGVFPPGSLTPGHYERAVIRFNSVKGCSVQRITYRSGGFRVTGLRVVPEGLRAGAHPLILFNRGGNREFGRLTAFAALRTLIPLALRNNALVYASNYRGVDGGEGRDEFGGAEVEDVLALLAIARNDEAWDGRHSLMLGHSRGSMMTALALKAGAQVNAAVLSAGVSDITASALERPELVETVFAQVMPGFKGDVKAHYRARSSFCWPEALRVPVLLLHGDADIRVNVMQSIRLAQALQKIRHPHELIIYKGDDHAMSRNWDNALIRIGGWMRRYAVASPD